MKGTSSNKGWHQRWFYLRSDANVPLPPYIGRYFEVALAQWGYGPIATEKDKINTLLQAVMRLVNHGVTGARVIVVFHKQRVMPLMRWMHRLDEMVPDVPLEGTMLMWRSSTMSRSRSTSNWRSGALLPTPPLTSTCRCVLTMTLSRW
jgi:hypothetical protein